MPFCFCKMAKPLHSPIIRHRRMRCLAIGLPMANGECIGCSTSTRVSGFSRCSTLCFLTKLNFNGVRAPLRGEGRGRKEKGGGRKGPAPGGPLRAAHPLPSLLPPWVPGTRPEIPLFVFFFFFFLYFFVSTRHQLQLLSGLFPLSLSTFSHVSLSLNVLLLQEVTS